MNKIAEFFRKEDRGAKVASTTILIVAFFGIFGPAFGLIFQPQAGASNNCGYGYGYGYGYGNTGYGYGNCTGYGYGYGYGYGSGGGSTNVADLQVVKTVSNAAPSTGTNVNYVLTVKNNGPLDENAVTLHDTLPAGAVFVSSTSTKGTYVNGTGIWNIGSLANGASAVLTITVNVTAGSGNAISNTATVAGDVAEPDLSNNTSTAKFTVPGGGGGGGNPGGGGSSGGGGGSSGGGSPTGQVLGDTTHKNSGSGPGNGSNNNPQILGETTGNLPRTGLPTSMIFLILMLGVMTLIVPIKRSHLENK